MKGLHQHQPLHLPDWLNGFWDVWVQERRGGGDPSSLPPSCPRNQQRSESTYFMLSANIWLRSGPQEQESMEELQQWLDTGFQNCSVIQNEKCGSHCLAADGAGWKCNGDQKMLSFREVRWYLSSAWHCRHAVGHYSKSVIVHRLLT